MLKVKTFGLMMLACLVSCADKLKPADEAVSATATASVSAPVVDASATAAAPTATSAVSAVPSASVAASAKPVASTSVEQCGH